MNGIFSDGYTRRAFSPGACGCTADSVAIAPPCWIVSAPVPRPGAADRET
jgi:hypothetical protein